MSEAHAGSYPLMDHPESLHSAGGKPLGEITLEAAAAGELTAEDLRVSAETLHAQAEIAAANGYRQLAANLRRAAELTAVPNTELLRMYETLRPNRATYAELQELAARLESNYAAVECAGFVREAADAYRAAQAATPVVTTLVAQIAPQRSTQYSALAAFLAPLELQLSPLGRELSALEAVTLGGQAYLRFELPTEPDARQLAELGSIATLDACFRYYGHIGVVAGPLLSPMEPSFTPALPTELVEARRYRGKTNELFTHFLCNLARFSSRWADEPWHTLRVFDPLAGGGTTLFTALVLGAEAAGVEQSDQDVNSTVAFLRQFLQEARISHRVQEERLRHLGRRWTFSIGKENPRRCILAHGETADAAGLIGGFKPQLIVADLPYGIQHQGPLVELFTHALPVWAGLLPPGGVLVYAWDATRFPRSEMIALVETTSSLAVLNTSPYDALSHRVDRVIKQRDVLVARRA